MINSINQSYCRTVAFSSDGYRLRGVLHLPGGCRPPVVVGSHGLLSSSASPKQIALARQCNAAGMAYFRFDHRGCGASQGKLEKETSLETRCSDMLHAVDFLKRRGLSCGRIGLFGSSMGGAVCISLAEALSADTLVINAAPVKIDRTVTVPDIPESLSNRIRFDITHHLSRLHHILIFHGDADEVVPASHSHLIHEHAKQPKRLMIFHKGDHVLSNPDHQQTFTRESVLWFRQHLC
jgi:alpha-beta hydrolase superfamily lysophospholipase